MSRHLATILMLSAALTGCGATPLVPSGANNFGPQVAAGWTSIRVTPEGTTGVDPCLIERKAGGYAIAYASDTLGDKHVYVTVSPDGQRWSAPVSVGKGPLTDEAPSLCEDEKGSLHVIFASNRGMRFGLYEATSTDAATWTDAEALPSDPDQAERPTMVPMASESLALAYETLGGSIHFRTRSAQGTWSAPSTVFDGAGDPTMALGADGKLVIAYKSYGKLYLRTQDPLGTWGAATVLSASGDVETPSLTRDAHDGWWLVCAEQSGDNWKLQERSTNRGTWSTEASLTAGPTDDEHPSALVNHSGERVLAFGVSSGARRGGIYFASHP